MTQPNRLRLSLLKYKEFNNFMHFLLSNLQIFPTTRICLVRKNSQVWKATESNDGGWKSWGCKKENSSTPLLIFWLCWRVRNGKENREENFPLCSSSQNNNMKNQHSTHVSDEGEERGFSSLSHGNFSISLRVDHDLCCLWRIAFLGSVWRLNFKFDNFF